WQGTASATLPGLSSRQRELICSDSSLTLQLERLLGERIEVDIKQNSTSTLSSEEATFLSEPPGAPSIEREVWLRAGSDKLVYAHSVIPKDCIEGWLFTELTEGTAPIGRVLEEASIPVTKQTLRIGFINSEIVATELELPVDTIFIARRYKLVNKKDDGTWVIKALLYEVFNPALISTE
ncbi:MAG: chorismate lyase, partial [Thermodesulfobacteriota bacterium]